MDILVMRHAEAEPGRYGQSDDDRDLTPDGEAEAAAAGKAMARLRLEPDVILCSPLVRARRTAAIVAGELCGAPPPIEEARLGIGAQPEHLRTILRANARCRLLLLVGHQPTVSRMVAQLAGGGDVEMPTAAFALIRGASATEAGMLRLLAPPAVARAIARG